MTFKTMIPQAFIFGALYWFDKTNEVPANAAWKLLVEIDEHLNPEEYEAYLLCEDAETLCYFDLLVGAAQP